MNLTEDDLLTTASFMSMSEDDFDMKPLFANYSGSVTPHAVHDFNIHLHKRLEFSLLDDGEQWQTKCSGTFSADTCCGTKRWTAEDVYKVISVETTFFRTSTFVIRFPDKKVNKDIVSKLHGSIRGVNFLQSPYARRCCVTLKDTNHSDVLTALNSTRFGSGFLSADGNYEELSPSVNDIDPFTLFLDNVPAQLEPVALVARFPTSRQITLGYTNKIYYTKRYAFVTYSSVQDATDAFRKTNATSDLIVRFRRFAGSAQLPAESAIRRCQKPETPSGVGPIVADPGPPVTSTTRTYKVVGRNESAVKCELDDDDPEIVLGDESDGEDVSETTVACPTTDFDTLFENMRRSRLQMTMLRENVLNESQ